VTYTNHAPVISGAASQSVAADDAYSFTPTASDPDSDPLTFSASGLPAWASFDTATGRVSGTPSNANVGTTNITITASDGSLSADFTYALTVTYTNHAPVISGAASQSVAADDAYSFTPTASDPDSDTLTFSASGLPGWASFDTATGRVSGTPSNAHVGTSNITITASDGSFSADFTYALTVTYTNHAPFISGPVNQSVAADSLYSFSPIHADPDGDPLTFSISGNPAWTMFNPVLPSLSGTPSNAHVGTTNITITASDGLLSTDFSFALTVTYTNHAPVISGDASQSVAADDAYSFTPTASDPDSDTLTFSASGLPGWASFDTATGQVSGTPSNAHVGTTNITITASDGSLSTDFTYALTVTYTNHAPVISGDASQSVAADDAYSFTPTASDPDSDTLTFSASGLPAWASFDTATGQVSGTPSNAHVGTTNITITASDGLLSADFTYALTVTYTNHAPVISGAASQSVAADDAYSFTPTASDPDSDTLTFSASGLPAWASFDTATGQVSGTPSNAHVGTSNITITVSDGSLSTDFTYALTVTYTNHAPVISGDASQSVAADDAYSFTPTASDPDSDPLTFSTSGLPAWASFETATGRVSGTPSNAHVGTTNITITASDGLLSADFTYALTVTYTNHAPVISGPVNQSVAADSFYSFSPIHGDPDGDTLSFSVSGNPPWTIFNPVLPSLSGTPSNADVGTSNVTITASDASLSTDFSFSLEVTYTNHAPLISGTTEQTAPADSLYSFTPTASDPDSDPLTFSASGLPGWASFDTATGQVSGTPSNANVGTTSITITASDGSLSTDFTYALTVTYTNHAPLISGDASQSVAADDVYNFTPSASDPDGDTLSFSVTGKPSWAAFNPLTGNLSGTPSNADVATYNVSIRVSDSVLFADFPFTLTVTYTNHAPLISGTASQTVAADDAYSYTPTASDPDSDTLTFSASGLPSWAAIDEATGQVSGTPSNADVGTSTITITVSDGTLSADFSYDLTVTYTNHAPLINGAASQTTPAESLYSFTPTSSDPDGDTLTFSASGLPGWASFNTSTGQVSGTPTNANVGTSNITITASDGALGTDFSFSLTVTHTNHAPQMDPIGDQSVAADNSFSFTPTASDPDGDTLSFSATGLPSWAAIDEATGEVSGTPSNAHVGISNITITASDGSLSDSEMFSLTVTYTNHAPTISGPGDQSIGTLVLYSFTPTASDPDGDPLLFSISGAPAWASFNTSTGNLSGTPTNANTGTSTITITVSDGTLSANYTYNLTVNYTNHAPLISGESTQSVMAQTTYSFTPTASDPDGDSLSFSISGKPAWATFNTTTGALTGTPQISDVGTSNITITASDGSLSTNFNFSLTVTPVNQAPTISGATTQSVTAGNLYDFTPTASDPDSDPLSFSITNKPVWATFDTATGRLSGTPTNTHSGTRTVTITVSDGSLTADLVISLTVVYAPVTPVCSTVTSSTYVSTPSADSYMEKNNPGKTPGSENRIKIRMDSDGDDTKHGLIKFNLSSIPANTVINSAYIYLDSKDIRSGQTTYFYRLTRDWVESTVSWNNASTGIPWTTGGGDYAAGAYASYYPVVNCMIKIDITNLVQGWIDGSYPNYGLLMLSTGTEGEVQYTSRDDGSASARPRLVVDY
jgi:hypothetical protein